jgi:S-adenosylmethionine hydrolase
MIFLFTDFGAADLYVGQIKAVLHRYAPGVPVIDVLHEAPSFNVKAGAHLLAALAGRLPQGSVTLAVVDPGVGGSRKPVALLADGRWFVGPDNGLLSVIAARAKRAEAYVIGWKPKKLSASFHGRDLFAPVTGMLARGDRNTPKLRKASLAVKLGEKDLARIIYVDHYGNAMTGLRAARLARRTKLMVGRRRVARARVFADVPAGKVFWYENSLGLAEIAANVASAARELRLAVGVPVRVRAPSP